MGPRTRRNATEAGEQGARQCLSRLVCVGTSSVGHGCRVGVLPCPTLFEAPASGGGALLKGETAHAPKWDGWSMKMKRRSAPPTHACMCVRPERSTCGDHSQTPGCRTSPHTTQYGQGTRPLPQGRRGGPKSASLDVRDSRGQRCRGERIS